MGTPSIAKTGHTEETGDDREVPGGNRSLIMAKIVQIVVAPLHNLGFTLMALDSEGQILLGELLHKPKEGPTVVWRRAAQESK